MHQHWAELLSCKHTDVSAMWPSSELCLHVCWCGEFSTFFLVLPPYLHVFNRSWLWLSSTDDCIEEAYIFNISTVWVHLPHSSHGIGHTISLKMTQNLQYFCLTLTLCQIFRFFAKVNVKVQVSGWCFPSSTPGWDPGHSYPPVPYSVTISVAAFKPGTVIVFFASPSATCSDNCPSSLWFCYWSLHTYLVSWCLQLASHPLSTWLSLHPCTGLSSNLSIRNGLIITCLSSCPPVETFFPISRSLFLYVPWEACVHSTRKWVLISSFPIITSCCLPLSAPLVILLWYRDPCPVHFCSEPTSWRSSPARN